MNLVKPVFTEYERQILQGVSWRRIHPPSIQRFLDAAGKPVGRLFQMARDTRNPLVQGISDRVRGWVQEALIQTVRTASRMTSSREVLRRARTRGIPAPEISSLRYLPISELDDLSDSFRGNSRLLLGLEGAALGSATTLVEGVPGATLIIPSLILADVTASLTLLSRQTCYVASAYGFSPERIENLPHIIGSLAPHTGTSDEGYYSLKTAVAAAIRESSGFASRTAGVMIDRSVLEHDAPQMVRLIASVAKRLGVTVTQKELGVLIPVAGAILNSSINIAFQHVCYQNAKDYFRLLLLEERYGGELVAVALSQEMDLLRSARPGTRTA
jgi:hypothetical protein